MSCSCAFAGQNPAFSDSTSAAKWQKISKKIVALSFNGLDKEPLKDQTPKQLMTLGLILSILGWVSTPIISGFGLLICLAGAIMGFLGIMKARKMGEKKYGRGIAAIIIGGLPLVFSILILIGLVIFIMLQEPIFF
jgi:hypothetical protein